MTEIHEPSITTPNMLLPTYSVPAAAKKLDRSIKWINKISLKNNVGHMEGRQRRLTHRDLSTLTKLRDGTVRGRPRTTK